MRPSSVKVVRPDRDKINHSVVDMAVRGNWGLKYIHCVGKDNIEASLARERRAVERRGFVHPDNVEAFDDEERRAAYIAARESNAKLAVGPLPPVLSHTAAQAHKPHTRPLQAKKEAARARAAAAERTFAEWTTNKAFRDGALECLAVIPKPSASGRGPHDSCEGGRRACGRLLS